MAFKPKLRKLVVAAALALGVVTPAAAEPVSLITLVAMKLAADYAIYIAIAGMLVSTAQQRRKAKKADAAQKAAYNASLTDRTQTLLSEEMPLTTIYGQPGPIGGALVATFTHGNKDQYKSVVVVYASHACTSFDGCFLDGVSVGTIGPDGWVMDGDFAGARSDQYFDAKVNFDTNGDTVIAGTVNSVSLDLYPDMVVELSYPSPTTTKIHVPDFVGAVNANNIGIRGQRTTYASKLRVRAHINGDGIADDQLIADSGGQWTVDHKLTGMTYIVYTFDLNESKFQSGFPNITAKFKGKAVYDPRDGQTKYSRNNALCLGDYITSPFGYGAQREAIHQGSWISAANACDEGFFNATSDFDYQLGGTTVRYTCDGSFNTSQDREGVRQDLEESMAGACYESGGVWVMKAGAWSAPILDLTDRDLLAPVQVTQSAYPGNERFNSIRLGYVNAAGSAAGVADDAPPYQNEDLIVLDNNEERWDSVSLPFTSSQMRATQLGRVRVEKSRGGLIVTVTPRILFWKLQPGDRVRLTHATLGMVTKTFRISEWTQSDTGPISLTMIEDVPAFYDLADLTQEDPAPNTNFPDPFQRPAPLISLAAASGPDQMLVNGNSVTPRTKVTWNQSQDVYVLMGGRTQIQWRLSSVEDAWKDTILAGEATETYLLDAPVGASISIRGRFINSVNSESEWALIGHTVQGLPESMAPGTNFTAVIGGDGIIASWDSPEGIYGAAWFESQVRVGTNWADGSVLWTGKAVKANLGWLIAGNRNLMLAHRKIDSDWSTPVNFGIAIRNPADPVVTGSTGYGTGTATWTDGFTDQPISYYDVRRGSATSDFNSAVAMVRTSLRKADFNEPAEGTFRYFVQAVDVAGNKSGVGQAQVSVSGTGIPGGATLPNTGTDGGYFYLNTTKTLYAWNAAENRWAPVGVQSGAALPAVAASRDGDTFILNGVLYRFTGGAWGIATVGIAQFAAGLSPVLIASSVPAQKISDVVSVNNTLYTWDTATGAYKATIPVITAGSIDVSMFASTVEVPMNYNGVPTTRQASDVIFNTANSKLYRWVASQSKYVADVPAADITGQVVSSQIADLAITALKMAQGLEPVTVVTGSLPTVKSTSVITFNNELYKWDATTNTYTKSIKTQDLVGSVQDAQIANITASKLVGQITDAQIAAVAASKLTGSIADSQITNLSATKLVGQVTSAQINNLDAAKLTGSIPDAILSVGGSNMIANSGFEDAATTTVPASWSAEGPVTAYSKVTRSSVYGSKAARLTANFTAGSYVSLIQSVACSAGTRYMVQGKIRASVAGTVVIYAQVRTGTTVTSTPNTGNLALAASTTTFTEFTLTVPTTAAGTDNLNLYYRFFPNAAGTGTVDYDDMQCEEGNVATAFAPKPGEVLDGSITSANIANLAITTAKMASGLQPVTVVTGSLPTTKSTEVITFNNELYRWDATQAKYTKNLDTASLTGTISDAQIAAVTASKIAGTLSDAQIAAVSATKVTGQIVTTQIKDDSISTAKLQVGSVSANVLAANAVTAGKLAVGDFENLVLANTGLTTEGWTAGVGKDYNPTGWTNWWNQAGSAGHYTLVFQQRNNQYGTYIPVQPGDQFYVEFVSVPFGGGASQCGFGIGFIIDDGSGGAVQYPMAAVRVPGTYGGVKTSGSLTIPAGYSRAMVFVLVDTSDAQAAQTGYGHYASNIQVRRKNKGSLIVDGAITTNLLFADAVTAEKLNVDAVLARNIKAGEIKAGKLDVNSVVSANIQAGEVKAVNIAANAITAEKLAITQQEPSLMLNPSFEDGMVGWSMTAYAGNDAPWAWVTGGADGTYCMWIGRPNAVNKACIISKAVPITPGAVYVLRYKYLVNGGGRANMLPYVFQHSALPPDGFIPYPGADYVDLLPGGGIMPNSNGVWQQYEQSFTARVDCKYLSVAIHNWEGVWDSAVYLHLDDFSIRKQITSAVIQDGAITTDKIFALSVIAEKIATDAITADKIKAGEVKAGKLAANSVLAVNIEALAVKAGKLDVGAVIAGNVAANVIGANEIAVAAITAKHMQIGDFENLCYNGQGLSTDGYSVTIAPYTQVSSGWASWWAPLGSGSDTALTSRNRDLFFGPEFAVKAGDQFYASYISVPEGGGSRGMSVQVGLAIMNSAGGVVQWFGIAVRPNEAYGGVFTEGSGTITATSAAKAKIWITIQGDGSDIVNNNKGMHFSDIQVRRKNTGKLIVDGAITANLVAANAIKAINIEGRTITAEKIAVGTISATEIGAGAVTTEKLTVTALLGENLVFNGQFTEVKPPDNRLPAAWSDKHAGNIGTRDWATEQGGAGEGSRVMTLARMSNDACICVVSRAAPVASGVTYVIRFTYNNVGGATRMIVVDGMSAIQPSDGYLGYPPAANDSWGTLVNSYVDVPANSGPQTFVATFVAPAGLKWFSLGIHSWTGVAYSQASYLRISDVHVEQQVVATQIKDGTITTQQIKANTIRVDNMAANSVDTDQLVANSVKLGKVAAGAINADAIQAGVIGVEKLSVSAFSDNLLLNGSFEEALGRTAASNPGIPHWYGGGSANYNYISTLSLVAAQQLPTYEGVGCMRLARITSSDATQAVSRAIPVIPGEQYRIRFAFRSMNGRAIGFHMAIGTCPIQPPNGFVDNAAVNTYGGVWTGVDSPGTVVNGSTIRNSNWVIYEAVYTIPGGMFWMSICPHSWSFPAPWEGDCYLDIDDVSIKRVINSALIANGAVNASKIQAGSITADKLLVQKAGVSLNNDPTFQDVLGSSWGGSSGQTQSTGFILDINDAPSGRSTWNANTGSRIQSLFFPITAGKTYVFSAWYRTFGGAVGLGYLRAHRNNGTTEVAYWSSFEGVPADNTGVWHQHVFTFVAEPSTNRCYIDVHGSWDYFGAPTGQWQFADVKVEEAVTGTLITDGAISTSKIQVGAVKADQIGAGEVTAGKLAVGSVTAEKLAVTTSGDNLVFNPGFEDGMTGWSMTAYAVNNAPWERPAGGAEGSWNFYIGRTDPAHRGCVMSRAMPITGGATYVVRFKYLVNSGGARANFLPYIFTRSAKPAGEFITYAGGNADAEVTTQLGGGGLVGPNGWQQFEQLYTAPVGQAWASIAIHNWDGVWEGGVYLHLDDFSFRKQITSAVIQDGSITTPKLVVGAVKADQIDSNAVTTAKIQVGAVKADQISAGAITAPKLAVADMENLVTNQASTEGWSGSILFQTGFASWWAGLGETGDTCLRMTSRNNSFGIDFRVKPGDQFYCKFLSVPTGGGASACPMGMGFVALDSVGNVLGFPMVAVRPTGTYGGAKSEGSYTVPANVAYLHVFFLVDTSDDLAGQTGYGHHIGNIELRRKNNAELIVDGAITTQKIKAGAVDTDQLAVGAVKAGKIDANAIVSTNIQAGEIKAINIGAGQITADKIAVGSGTGNLVMDSEFYQGAQGTRRYENGTMVSYGVNYSNNNPSMLTSWGINWPDDNWHPRGGSGYGIRQGNADYAGGDPTVYFAQLFSPTFSVEGGQRYEFSYYSGAHRCRVFAVMLYYDANGNGIVEHVGSVVNEAEMAGGPALSNYKRIGGFSTAPANAAMARLCMRKGPTYPGQGDSYLFLCKPMVAAALVNQTQFSPYVPSGNGTLITSNGIDTPNLSALSATVGLLRTATDGQRLEIESNQLRVYDSQNRLRLRLGIW